MSADVERMWLREWSWRREILWFGPLLAVFVCAPLLASGLSSWFDARWYVIVLLQAAAITVGIFGLRHSSVAVNLRTGLIERYRQLHAERTETHQRLRVDLQRTGSLSYAFVRRLNGTETFEALCSDNVLVWRHGAGLRSNFSTIIPRSRTGK
jgi:hypothetical protein